MERLLEVRRIYSEFCYAELIVRMRVEDLSRAF